MQICFLKNELKPSNIKRGEIIIVFSWPRNSSESRIASLGRSKKQVRTTPALRRSALPPSHPSHPHPSIPLDPNLGKKVDTDSPSPRFGPRRRSSGFYLVPSTAATTNAAAAIAPSTYLPTYLKFLILKLQKWDLKVLRLKKIYQQSENKFVNSYFCEINKQESDLNY